MKKLTPMVLIIILAAALAGCASGENSILSISFDGVGIVEDSLVIDETARTVSATIKPVDISTVTPVFGLSANAVIGDIVLTDGDNCTCTVTAEDGKTSEWTVTVTVQPGVSFKYDGEFESFICGILGSSDSDASEDYGNGVPYYSACTTGQSGDSVVAFREEYDLDESEIADLEILMLVLSNEGSSSSGMIWRKSSINTIELYIEAVKISTGEVGGFVTGSFVEAVESADNITDGFFKVLRIADDLGMNF